jgi:thiol-disulfide isomerase/thioredoxin
MLKKIFLLLFLIPLATFAQHTITGSFSPAEDFNYVILYRVEPTKNYYTTDSNKDEKGDFNFVLDSTNGPGVYKVVYGIPQEQKNFDLVYNGEEDISFAFSETEGVVFSASEENQLLAAFEAQMYQIQKDLITGYQTEPVDESHVVSLFKEQELLQNEFEKQANLGIAVHFIKANRLYTPSKFEDFKTYVKNRKDTYFKNVNYADEILQRSSFLDDNAKGYIVGFVNPEAPDESYIANINDVAKALETTSITYQKTLWHSIWSYLVTRELFNASKYLANNYLIPVAKMDKDTSMVNTVFKFQNLTIGSEAPNFSWEEEVGGKTKTIWLNNLKPAENYLIIFWSSACSHCLDEIPKIHTSVKDVPENKLKIIAVGMEDEPYSWKNLTYDLPRFTHVYGAGKWDNDIAKTYDITSTPTYFVLDSKKRIVAKPETLEELMRGFSEEK